MSPSKMDRGTQTKEIGQGGNVVWMAVDGDAARHAVTCRVEGRVWRR